MLSLHHDYGNQPLSDNDSMAEEKPQPEERKRKKKAAAPTGAPMWMVTYSDLVTLLLTFFVLLLSMASLDPIKFTEASNSLRDAFGMHVQPAHTDFAIPVLPSPPITEFSPMQQQMTVKMYRKIKTRIEADATADDVEMIQQEDGTIILRVKDTVLFAPGETQISPDSFPLLRYIADTIRPLPLRLRIEGHTDARTDSRSELGKWDISMARAVSVMRFLKKGDHMPLQRMAAAGYGATKPLATNATEAGRTRNRRVDFVLRADTDGNGRQTDTAPSNIPF